MKYISLHKSLWVALFLVAFPLTALMSQTMKSYTWDSYKTKFEIPSDFNITTSDSKRFSAGNNDINLSIYPRLDEYLSYEQMENSLAKWAAENGVALTDEGVVYLDDLNGYWGVMAHGTKDDFPIFLMLIIDPDYEDTSLYIWLSYRESKIEVAEKILMSFTPN